MYVITTTFTGDSERIEAARGAHREWLDQQLADGVLLLAGRRDPPIGGVVIASDVSREELDRRLAAEPYAVAGVAENVVVTFVPSRAAEGLAALLK